MVKGPWSKHATPNNDPSPHTHAEYVQTSLEHASQDIFMPDSKTISIPTIFCHNVQTHWLVVENLPHIKTAERIREEHPIRSKVEKFIGVVEGVDEIGIKCEW
mmetsp:Transcript_8370/g.12356  ORF Transcript_8370/g.12356 Transcript_8370/m.12356 type:complete len:103 (+) Transcript_8370:204-512(+)